MTKGQKLTAKAFYNQLVRKNYKFGYFSDITANIMGNYCFQYEVYEEFSTICSNLKDLIEGNNFEVIRNKIDTNKFLAIYRG